MTCTHSVFDKLTWCTIVPKSFLFGTVQFSFCATGTVNYDYIITNSINSLLIGSRCIPNAWYTCTLTIVEPIWPMFQNVSKTLQVLYNTSQYRSRLNETSTCKCYLTG